uniref:Uncharacterized protein n=1 Tax=Arundo donax TaxID=35708 RepID=A0A0A9HE02_ARUDO
MPIGRHGRLRHEKIFQFINLGCFRSICRAYGMTVALIMMMRICFARDRFSWWLLRGKWRRRT